MSEKIGQVERKIRNSRAIYECWACHRMVESVNSRNHFCKPCNATQKELIERRKTDKVFADNEKCLVECVTKNPFSVSSLGLYWNNEGERIEMLRRDLQDDRVQVGLARGRLKIVNESPEAKFNETEDKVQPTNETKKELKPSMFYALELVGERNWSAPNIGLYWKNKGDIQRINERNLRDFEVQSGLKRGLIRIVEEEQEPIEPKISEEIKQKTDTASGGDW